MDPFLSATIENLSEYFVANSRTSLTDFMDSANNSGSSTNNIMNSPIFDSLDNSSDGGSSGLNTNANKQTSATGMNQPPSALDQLPSNSNDLDQFDLQGCNDLINTSSGNTGRNLNHHYHSTTSNPINHSSRSTSGYRHTSTKASATASLSSSSRHLFSQSIRTQVPIYCQIEQFDSCPSSNVATTVTPTTTHYYQPTLNDNDLFRTTDNLEDTFKKPAFHHPHHSSGSSVSNNQAEGHVPHLHQSKLALESVTNCNGSTSTSGLLESSLPQLISQQQQKLKPPPPPPTAIHPVDSIDGECVDDSLADDRDVKPKGFDDFDCLGVDFDGLGDHDGSASPLSMHQESSGLEKIKSEDLQQLSILNNSNTDSINNHHNQDNYEQQLSSSKEAYVLVQASTPWLDLVRTVLTQLGYSGLDIVNSKATLMIKNWKPLPLDQVTDDKKATVGEVLSELHGFVTLRVTLVNSALSQAPTEWTETMIRQIVTTLCQSMSQLTLSKLCNISQPLISAIVRGGKRLGRRKCEEFGQWYLNYIKSMDSRPAPAMQTGESTGAARLVFDKTREIPQLKAWFAESTKPSEEMLECYSKILNEERKFKPQVSAKALKNWWKNERQKLGIRQRENRGRPRLKRID